MVEKDDYDRATKVATGKTKPGLGIAASTAGAVVGLYWLLMLVGRFVGMSVAQKVSSRAMLSVAAGLGLAFVALAIVYPSGATLSLPMPNIGSDGSVSFGLTDVPLNILFLVLCGLCTSVMWGGIFNLAVDGLGKYTATASGIFMMMVCGGGILPLAQNAIADFAGYHASYWLPFAGLAFLLFYALVGSRNINKNIRVE